MVTKKDVCETLKSLGVNNGDILLFHSSLKSFGEIENGADTVIDGVLDAVGTNGTAVVPTLVQKDFSNAYKNWNKDTSPSDVGFITETFRKRKNAIRSDQATHSVSAIGKMAEFLTNSHSSFGPRFHAYGDYAFSHGSPWQKMYDNGAKVVFMGCGLEANTFHHFIEALYTEEIFSTLPDNDKVKQMKKVIVDFSMRDEHQNQLIAENNGGPPHTLIRFSFGKRRTNNVVMDKGLYKEGYCGPSKFLLFDVKEYVDTFLEHLRAHPEEYYSNDILNWIEKAKKKIKET